jgi:hypothetical protein
MVMTSTGVSEKNNFFFFNWKIIIDAFSCFLLSVKCVVSWVFSP